MGPFTRKRSSSESRVSSRRSKSSESDRTDKLPVPIGHCTLNTVEDNFHLFATLGKKKSLTKLLDKSNFPIDIPNCLGQNALFCACYTGKDKVVQMLLERGANPNFRCSGDYTPVHGACWSCNMKILILLLEAGGDIRSRDARERQPKDWCILQSNVEKGQYILQFINLLESIVANFSDNTFSKNQLNVSSQSSSKLWEQLLSYAHKISRKSAANVPPFPDFPINFLHYLGHGNLCIGNSQLCTAGIIPHINEKDLRMIVGSTGQCAAEASIIMERMEWNNTKVIRKRIKENCSLAMLDTLILELNYLRQLHHPNLLLLLGVCPLVDFKSTSLIFENIELGSLNFFLYEERMTPNLTKSQDILLQISEALVFLHSRFFIHCAISSHSIHLINFNVAKLGNCGYMVQCGKDGVGVHKALDMVHFQDLYPWLAPEIISDEKPTLASDIYGFASVVLELVTLRVPWSNYTSEQISHCLLKKNLRPELPPFVMEPFNLLLSEGLRISVADRMMTMLEIRDVLTRSAVCIKREQPEHSAKSSYSADSLLTHHMEGPSLALTSEPQEKPEEKFTTLANLKEEHFISRKTDIKLQRGQTLPRLNLRPEAHQTSGADDNFNFIQNPEKRKFFQSTHIASSTLPIKGSKNASGRYSVTPRPISMNKIKDDENNLGLNSSVKKYLTSNKSCHVTVDDSKQLYQCQSARDAKSPTEPRRFSSSCSLQTTQTSKQQMKVESLTAHQAPEIQRNDLNYSGKFENLKFLNTNYIASSRGDMTPTTGTTNSISIKPASHLTGTPLGTNLVAQKLSDTCVPFTRYSKTLGDKGGSLTTLWNDSSSITTDSMEVHASCTSSPTDTDQVQLAPAMDEWFAGRGSVQGLISSFETRRTDRRNTSFGSWKSLTLPGERRFSLSPAMRANDKMSKLVPSSKRNSFVIERRQSLGAEYGDLEISVSTSTPSKTTSTSVTEKGASRNTSINARIEDLYFDDELNNSNCQEEHLKLLDDDVQNNNTLFTAKITPVFGDASTVDDSNPSTPRSISDIQLEDATIKVIQVKAEPGYSCTVRTESNSLGSGTHHVTLTKKHMESGKEEVIEEVIHADVVQHHIIMEK